MSWQRGSFSALTVSVPTGWASTANPIESPVGVKPVAFEVQNGVHHVLHHLGTGDGAGLGDMSDYEHGHAGSLRETDQPAGAFFNLRQARTSVSCVWCYTGNASLGVLTAPVMVSASSVGSDGRAAMKNRPHRSQNNDLCTPPIIPRARGIATIVRSCTYSCDQEVLVLDRHAWEFTIFCSAGHPPHVTSFALDLC